MSDFTIGDMDEREIATDLARVIDGTTFEQVTYEAEEKDLSIIVTATVGNETKTFELSVAEIHD
ncbi:hypothetical protein [Nocardia terpenica]|nr:hypothetical protein [Nocardia terpenica]NQE89581.1 hypothetical protein [Nocardia terpenica]